MPVIEFGLWDEASVVTPLQLAVVVSVSAAVSENHVEVMDQGNHFFKLDIANEGEWLYALMQTQDFMDGLNTQCVTFGCRLVLFQPAVKRTERGAEDEPQAS